VISTRLNTIRIQGPNPSGVDCAEQTPLTVGKHWTRYIFPYHKFDYKLLSHLY